MSKTLLDDIDLDNSNQSKAVGEANATPKTQSSMAAKKPRGRTTKSAAQNAESPRSRPKVQWSPSEDMPKLPPDGEFRYRWLRSELREGKEDNRNINSSIREGWSLVTKADNPELESEFESYEKGRYAGVYGFGGLIMARMPYELFESRNQYYHEQTHEQIDSISSSMTDRNNRLVKNLHSNYERSFDPI